VLIKRLSSGALFEFWAPPLIPMSILPTSKTPPNTELCQQKVLIYGRPKIGKSTFCSHIDRALFLDLEGGLNSLNVCKVSLNRYEDTLLACSEIKAGNHPYATIVIDPIENLLKQCSDDKLKKLNIDHESDLPYGKGYAIVWNELQRVLTKLVLLPYGLILVSHCKEVEIETRTGKYTRVVPSLPDKIQNIVLGFVDMILYCDLECDTDPDGQQRLRRVIRTKPSLYYEAGDRTGRLPETLDLDFSKFQEAFNGSSTPTTTTEIAIK
jgi:hypothetical protein